VAQGDLPTSRGGPLRRRKEKRQLEHLAHGAQRDGSAPHSGAAHVRVLDGQVDVPAGDHPDDSTRGAETPEPTSSAEAAVESRTGGFHVRAVPIDQPFAD
jgi:hypothetical protein